ncbi:ubiquinol-cytochrome c reductase iron-sulfur subunit [Chengkuizengella sediminis]|uniref:ubiquinol-cytochrome c reductase iron-sulfur subunit n=1 Tax=Chengkuizengella sediminis TaxID=1885917 RepID=UPI003B8319F7
MQDHNKEKQSHGKPVKRREMSRRQFLSYTLGGTGGFMMSLPLIANLRFAVDPLLQPKAESDWVKVIEVEKINETPTSVKFEKNVVDGWYESDKGFGAWITKDANGDVFALSPICKHLGCTVEWEKNVSYPNEYFCPCHAARYTKDGKNLAVAPAPLDEYDVKIENGSVYLSQIKPNTRVE